MSDLFGLGAGTPSRFPYPDRPQPAPGLGPSAGQNVRARIVVVFGPAGTVSGVFVYAPGTTPGPGNTPIAAMTASATDPYGNSVQPGDASALGTIIAIGVTPPGGTSSYAQLAPGNPAQLRLGTGDSAELTPEILATLINGTGPTRVLAAILQAPHVTGQTAFGADLRLFSPSVDLTATPFVVLEAGSAVTTFQLTISPTTAKLATNAIGSMLFCDSVNQVTVAGFPITAASVAGGTGQETWHTLGALAAGSGYTVNNGRFQLDNNGFVMVDVNLIAGAATVAGNYAFATALPVGQRPPFQCSYPLGYNGTVTTATNTLTLRISTAGTVTLQLPVLPNGTVVSATQRVPVS